MKQLKECEELIESKETKDDIELKDLTKEEIKDIKANLMYIR